MPDTPTTPASVAAADSALTGHRHYDYRGCAPDPDRPGLAAAADIPLTSWDAPDLPGGEPQEDRLTREEAALAVCAACPVLAACRTWSMAATETDVLPYGVSGGLTALERHRLIIESRMAAGTHQPVRQEQRESSRYRRELVRVASTPQKLAVLRALATHTRPEDVAAAAGLDVRTANWQRSKLAGLFGLDRHRATRLDLLHAARAAGLLDGVVLAPDDGSVLAAPALESPDGPRRTVPAPAPDTVRATEATRTPNLTPPPTPAPAQVVAVADAGRRVAVRVRVPARTRFADIPGQLCLDDAAPPGRRTLRLLRTTPAVATAPALESAA
ncbi:WhiB family transcriptional regulator [Streptomyces sp. NPDC058657]|uniref:WhiB family transcriptional regulator n=1 Tax=unclassified Streptomyces TaxID=2593676 RepID=UPI003653E7E4